MAKLVLLDRDGVLNVDRPGGVRELSELEILPGALEAVAELTAAGFTVAVVTNQSVIGKGLASRETVDRLHEYLSRQAEAHGGRIAAFYLCPDAPDQPESRRKPAPDMLLEALNDFQADAAATPFVGDDRRDLAAAHAAGCPSYLVLTGKGAAVKQGGLHLPYRPQIAEDLRGAARHIIERFA